MIGSLFLERSTMRKVLIYLQNNTLIFSNCEEKIEDKNLNNTNVINTEKLIFSEDYIMANHDLVGSFLKLVAIKNQVNKAIIKEIEVVKGSLSLLKEINVITSVVIEDDERLNYEMVELLMDNPHLEEIDCYYMPEFLFERLTIYYHRTVRLRNENFFLSTFMEENHLVTYSDIFYKKKLTICCPFKEEDYDELKTFFQINNALKEIIFCGYSHDLLVSILSYLPSSIQNLKITITQMDSDDITFLNEIHFLKQLEKKYPVTIHIRYSKAYKEKNILKQINLQFVKFFCLFVALVGLCYFLGYRYHETKEMGHVEAIKDELKNLTEESKEPVIEEPKEEEPVPPETPQVDAYHTNYTRVLSELKKQNKDLVGWIKVENTSIDYPIVQTDDNLHYLNHSFDGKKSLYGWIFADYRNHFDTLSQNTIIYGHNVRGTNLLFGSLKKVLEPNWYQNKTNQVLQFHTEEGSYRGEIFSIYTIPVTSDYLVTTFYSDQSFKSYVNQEKERSIYEFGVSVEPGDSILTLSTCYQDGNHRLVVHAKLVKEG